MKRITFPRPRQLWRQVHWFVGITAGTLLMLIGLTGAILSFREEITDALNPGGRQVAPLARPVLTPPELLAAAQRTWPARAMGTLTVFNEPGAAARAIFAPQAGQRRGDTVYLDPYTAQPLPSLKGHEFFETAESLHRWLLLPRAPGRVVAGVLAFLLLGLALSGLYVRWPREWRSARAWFAIASHLKGRALLTRWHVVLGTVVLPLYLVLTGTGLYWAYDFVRGPVDAWFGAPPRAAARAPAKAEAAPPPAPADLAPAWAAFTRRAQASDGWSQAILRVSGGKQPSVMVTWMDAHPAHERARNRMKLSVPGAEVMLDERHSAKSTGERFLAAIYPLHMGSYFGLPGRIAMLLAALALPVFGVTGWWLYLDRRAKKRKPAARAARPDGQAASPV
ncbi:MAG: PepSY-associated TM helix domain-containing protein [Acidovorax sp.]